MPRPPMTEEQKQVLRERLANARLAKARKALEPKKEVREPVLAYHSWTEKQWQTHRIDTCKARLAQLKGDFEIGARIVGQRADANDPTSYCCFVCNKAVPEVSPSGRGPGWVWKHDYLNPKTGLYESVVICTQYCHTVYANDTRLQGRLRDLMNGKAADQQPAEETASVA